MVGLHGREPRLRVVALGRIHRCLQQKPALLLRMLFLRQSIMTNHRVIRPPSIFAELSAWLRTWRRSSGEIARKMVFD